MIEDVLGTRFGTIWGLRLLAFAALALILLVPAFGLRYRALRPVELGATGAVRDDALPRSPVVVIALGLALGFLALAPGLAGHPGVTDPRWLALGAGFAHVLAFSVWVGGLALLLAARSRPRPGRWREPSKTALLASAVGRFSTVALVAVAVLLASGVVQSMLQLDAWSDLVEYRLWARDAGEGGAARRS